MSSHPPLLYSLYSNDCVFSVASVKLLKFADDITVIGLITKSKYHQEVQQLASWCSQNNLELNPPKTTKISAKGEFLTALGKFPSTTGYTDAVLCYNYRKHPYLCHHYLLCCSCLQRTAEAATHYCSLSLEDLYIARIKRRAGIIISDTSHAANYLFQKLPSGKRFRSLITKTTRHRDPFFPLAISVINQVVKAALNTHYNADLPVTSNLALNVSFFAVLNEEMEAQV